MITESLSVAFVNMKTASMKRFVEMLEETNSTTAFPDDSTKFHFEGGSSYRIFGIAKVSIFNRE